MIPLAAGAGEDGAGAGEKRISRRRAAVAPGAGTDSAHSTLPPPSDPQHGTQRPPEEKGRKGAIWRPSRAAQVRPGADRAAGATKNNSPWPAPQWGGASGTSPPPSPGLDNDVRGLDNGFRDVGSSERSGRRRDQLKSRQSPCKVLVPGQQKAPQVLSWGAFLLFGCGSRI
jgi:hypothetical protein